MSYTKCEYERRRKARRKTIHTLYRQRVSELQTVDIEFYYVGTVLNIFYVITHLILTTMCKYCYYSDFTIEKIEAERESMTCLRSPS